MKKNIVISIVIVLIIMGGYILYKNSNTTQNPNDDTTTNSKTDALVDEELIPHLEEKYDIKIVTSTSYFDADGVYIKDYTTDDGVAFSAAVIGYDLGEYIKETEDTYIWTVWEKQAKEKWSAKLESLPNVSTFSITTSSYESTDTLSTDIDESMAALRAYIIVFSNKEYDKATEEEVKTALFDVYQSIVSENPDSIVLEYNYKDPEQYYIVDESITVVEDIELE